MVVETNGRASLCGEHSPVDALIPAIVMEYINQVPVDKSAFKGDSQEGSCSRVDWVVDGGLKREIAECQGRNKKLIEDSNASQLWWGEYGVEWIKKHGMSLKTAAEWDLMSQPRSLPMPIFNRRCS